MMRARRTCLSPTLRCLGKALLQDVGDEDQELRTGERARNPVPTTVVSVLIGIEIIDQLRQCVLVSRGLEDPEAQPVQIRITGSDDGDADNWQRALEILENGGGGLIEPVRRSALVVHEANATAEPHTNRSTRTIRHSSRKARVHGSDLVSASPVSASEDRATAWPRPSLLQ
jgi:hypothetical protein